MRTVRQLNGDVTQQMFLLENRIFYWCNFEKLSQTSYSIEVCRGHYNAQSQALVFQ